jgi:uncharacterized protein YkwD
MKHSRRFSFLLILFLAFFSAATAQIGVSNGNFSFETQFSGDEVGVLSRPRIARKTVSANVAPVTVFDLEKKAFQLINEKRAALKLAPLEWSEDVARVARVHSQNMAQHKFFSHTGFDGSMVDDRADQNGLSRWRAIGENIAYNRGYENPIEFAVERWMLSPKHKQNLLDTRWKESAVGIAVASDGSHYFTQVFLLRK